MQGRQRGACPRREPRTRSSLLRVPGGRSRALTPVQCSHPLPGAAHPGCGQLAPPRGPLGPRRCHSPPASPPASALCSPGVVIAGVEPHRSRVLMGVWTQRGQGVGVLPPLCLHPGVALGGSEPARPWRSAPPPFPALLFCPGAGGLGDRPLIFYSFQGFEAGEIGPALGGGMVRWRRARQGAFLGVQP